MMPKFNHRAHKDKISLKTQVKIFLAKNIRHSRHQQRKIYLT